MPRRTLPLTDRALARRALGQLDRLMLLRLLDDGADTGPLLRLSERTLYRAAATLLDPFERDDEVPLGAGYLTPTGFDTMSLLGQTVQPSGIGHAGTAADHMALATTPVLSVHQWAEIVIGALYASPDPGYADVGVALRFDTGGSGYGGGVYEFAGVRYTWFGKWTAGVYAGDIIPGEVTRWVVGDTLRIELEWDHIRIYQNGTLVAQGTDATYLRPGSVGLEGYRASAPDTAAITAWAAGPLTEEYAGLVMEMGDISASMGLLEPTGTPASWTTALSNLAPIAGAARLSHLFRYGANTAVGLTHDVVRAPVRVLTGLKGGDVPLSVVSGKVQRLSSITEARVTLECVGRDGLLKTELEPGRVAYIPGPFPTLAPVVEDPCGVDEPPEIIPPADLPPPPPEPGGGGPEGPPVARQPLLGSYLILIGYRPGDGSLAPPEPPWVYYNQVIPLPASVLFETGCGGDAITPQSPPGHCPDGWLMKPDGNCHRPTRIATFFSWDAPSVTGPLGDPIGAGLFYHYMRRTPSVNAWNRVACLLYRGPDVIGTDVVAETTCGPIPGVTYETARMQAWGRRYLDVAGAGGIWDGQTIANLKLARYDASQIFDVSDLTALRMASPGDPGEWNAQLPSRIETLLSTTVQINNANDPKHSLEHDGPLPTGPKIPVNQFTGPSLLALELITDGLDAPTWGGANGNDALVVAIVAEYLRSFPPHLWPVGHACSSEYQFNSNSGMCDAGPHHYEYADWWYCAQTPTGIVGPNWMSVRKTDDPFYQYYLYAGVSPPSAASGYYPFNLIIKQWDEPGQPSISNPAPSCGAPTIPPDGGPPWPHGPNPPPGVEVPDTPYPEKPDRMALAAPSLGT